MYGLALTYVLQERQLSLKLNENQFHIPWLFNRNAGCNMRNGMHLSTTNYLN